MRGSGFFPAVRGMDVAAPLGGRLPTVYRGASVRVASVAAPILWVSSAEGLDRIAIQVPCESPTGTVPISLTFNGQSIAGQVSVFETNPGIVETADWESTDAQRRSGVVIRQDGSYVSASNPALSGETVTGIFTGLGATIEPRITGATGTGQMVPRERVVVGVANQGVPVESVTYAPGRVGVYLVRFTIEGVTATGSVPYAVAVRDGNGNLVFGNSSILDIR
ncbi:MAG: hypothetical protein SFV18_08280 [Bryobacteraceae bacterium]|nr:hypothetical protein [Bryobacteraceae bacterium]